MIGSTDLENVSSLMDSEQASQHSTVDMGIQRDEHAASIS
jgi:hypothetical protein